VLLIVGQAAAGPLAGADPDTPERQRRCGVVPVGDQVQITVPHDLHDRLSKLVDAERAA
jgi:hypothetical protein